MFELALMGRHKIGYGHFNKPIVSPVIIRSREFYILLRMKMFMEHEKLKLLDLLFISFSEIFFIMFVLYFILGVGEFRNKNQHRYGS